MSKPERERAGIAEELLREIWKIGVEECSSNDCKEEELTPPGPPLERNCSSSSEAEVPPGPPADTKGNSEDEEICQWEFAKLSFSS